MSNLGSWMQTVALGVLVFARTGQPAWTGLVAAAGFVPIGLLAPVGGALADRLDRRRWLIVTTLAETSFAAVLAVLAGTRTTTRRGSLVLLSFLGGASGAIGFPAYQAMVPDLVPPEDLLGAVSLSSAQFNLGRVIGPALAGLVLLTHELRRRLRHQRRFLRRRGRGPGSWSGCPSRSTPADRHRLDGRASSRGPGRPWPSRAAASAIELHRRGGPAGLAVHRPGAGHGRTWSIATGIEPRPGHRPAGHRPGDRGGGRRPGPRRRWPSGSGGSTVLRTALFVRARAARAATAWPRPWRWPSPAFVAVGAGYICVLSGLNTVVQLRAPAAARGRVLSIYMMAPGPRLPARCRPPGVAGRPPGVRAVTVAGAVVLLGPGAPSAAAPPVDLHRPGRPGADGDRRVRSAAVDRPDPP